MRNLFGYYIKKVREEKGLSLRGCATICGLSHTHIDSLEKGFDFRNGKKVSPSTETIEKISSGLHIREQSLLNLALDKVEKKFNCFLYYNEREDLKASSRNAVAEHKKNGRYSTKELIEFEENIFIALFSRSVEASDFNIEHVDFPTYVSMLLNQLKFKNDIPDEVYTKLVAKYGISHGIDEGTYYKIPDASNNTSTEINIGIHYNPIIHKIPILGRIAAGLPLYAEEHIEGYTYTEHNGGAEYFALRVKGDSMNAALINDGSLIIVRRQPEVENGQIAVVRVEKDDATVKRFRQDGDTVQLIPQSYNPTHQTQIYDLKNTNIEIIGKVVECKVEF